MADAEEKAVLATLPAEVRERVEKALAAYGKEDGPAEAANLFPEQPLPGETVVAPPLPKQPPRRLPNDDYASFSNVGRSRFVKSVEQSRRPARKPPPAIKEKPPWNTSPSGKWRKPLAASTVT